MSERASESFASKDLVADARAVDAALRSACVGLVDRESVAEVVMLCAVAGEHLLVIGEPGTAKSEAVRRVAAQLGESYFEYLLGRFTEPNEIFGPVDLQRLREGVVEIETAGMLPEAQIAFLDEVFLGSTAILNTLLGILNERRFRRGRTEMACPLRLCVGAANVLPDEPALQAFADRFLARLFVQPVSDSRLEELMEVGAVVPPEPGRSLNEALDRLTAAGRGVSLDGVRPLLASGVRRLRGAGIGISDRRAVRVQRLVAAAAVLDGRDQASARDLWVLPLIASTADGQQLARETLGELLADSRNATLVHSAEELSRGVFARAERFVREGRSLIEGIGDIDTDLPVDMRIRVEALLREIDAAFTVTQMPADLSAVRAQLVRAIPPV